MMLARGRVAALARSTRWHTSGRLDALREKLSADEAAGVPTAAIGAAAVGAGGSGAVPANLAPPPPVPRHPPPPAAATGPRTFAIETYGCQMNVSDSEVVRAILLADGWCEMDPLPKDYTRPREDLPPASVPTLTLINTCAIRDNAENKIWWAEYYRGANVA